MATGSSMNENCKHGEWHGWDWRYGDSYHLSPLQFDPTSWGTAAAHTGLTNPEDNYDVGANTAWWSNNTTPSEQWSCWP